MTLPAEQARALDSARELLADITTPAKTPGVPKEIRERARSALRHFPPAFAVRDAYAALNAAKKANRESTSDWFWKRTKSG